MVKGRAPLVGEKLNMACPPSLFSPIDPFVNCGLLNQDLRKIEQEGLKNKSSISIIAKSVLTRLLFNSAYPCPDPVMLCGLEISNITTKDVILWLREPCPNDRAKVVYFANMHNVNTCVRDSELTRLYNRADFVLPDGVGLRIGVKLLRKRFKENISGTNLLPLLCRFSVEQETPIYLIGGKPGVAQRCAKKMKDAHPGLDTRALSDGYQSDYREVIQYLKANGRKGGIVLVGMGVGNQERWIEQYKSVLAGYSIFAVGGLFDYHAGQIKRAPKQWQSSGLEWLWRVKMEPRRLFVRYFGGFPEFLFYLVSWRWIQRD